MNHAILKNAYKGAENTGITLQETLWGHRFISDQPALLILLETLSLLYSVQKSEHYKLLVEPETSTIHYSVNYNILLRYLLFNCSQVQQIAQSNLDDQAKWEKLEAHIIASKWCHDPSFLKARFKRYDDFATLIHFFASTAIGTDTGKRWTSKFVYPHGPDCIYLDARVKGTTISDDHRFFGRGGEMVYLMLCRSKHRGLLAELIERKLLDPDARLNTLISALSDPAEQKQAERTTGYLPYDKRPEYDNLALDWIAILQCELPREEAIGQIAAITSLHLSLYFLNVSNAVLSPIKVGEIQHNHPDTHMIIDCGQVKSSGIRQASARCFVKNDELSLRAIESAVDAIKTFDSWQSITQSNDPLTEAKRYLAGSFRWDVGHPKISKELAYQPTDLKTLMALFTEAALKKIKRSLKGCYRLWCRDIGLLFVRKGQKPRYSIGDELLKTFVYANVKDDMEFYTFLSLLDRRYGIIIGFEEAKGTRYEHQMDAEEMIKNANSLADRLMALGMLKQLSDSCAYVRNPFGGSTDE